ncbi:MULTISPECIES: adenosylcobinamide amidohydrolase [Haloferacaceae]|uniref:Adenosylcobinamide amidohydrolase n=1 Tax=Halorubrum glutamatedens TaxID=2707018 RepID=A0ABD5QQT5_9EURY|nr:adenosylcobinamide amidohydrolase [Halobellus captivus]
MSGRRSAFSADVIDGVCRFRRTDGPTRFLSTGFDGGVRVADAAYNVTVPEGWDDAGRRDLREYVDGRVDAAGFADAESDGAPADTPALLTGVDQRHGRVARLDGATVLATAGVSNPAALPLPEEKIDPAGTPEVDVRSDVDPDATPPAGTVNLLVGADRPLAPGALANLVAVAAEAKAATLLATVGFPGTTSDAVVVGCPPERDSDGDGGGDGNGHGCDNGGRTFSGSATAIGAAIRACVRDAVRASLGSRYGPELEGAPQSVATAEYGVVTDRSATVSIPAERDHVERDPASGDGDPIDGTESTGG